MARFSSFEPRDDKHADTGPYTANIVPQLKCVFVMICRTLRVVSTWLCSNPGRPCSSLCAWQAARNGDAEDSDGAEEDGFVGGESNGSQVKTPESVGTSPHIVISCSLRSSMMMTVEFQRTPDYDDRPCILSRRQDHRQIPTPRMLQVLNVTTVREQLLRHVSIAETMHG